MYTHAQCRWLCVDPSVRLMPLLARQVSSRVGWTFSVRTIELFSLLLAGSEKVHLVLKCRSAVLCGLTGKRGSFTSVLNSRNEPYHQILFFLTYPPASALKS